MIKWLKEHIIELISLIITIFGVNFIVKLWNRFCEMFSSYLLESLLLMLTTGSIILLAFATMMNRLMSARINNETEAAASQLVFKDKQITELKEYFEQHIEELVINSIETCFEAMADEMQKVNDPDSVILDRIEKRELDGFSIRVLKTVLKMGVNERRWLRSALEIGDVFVPDRDIDFFDRGLYFSSLVSKYGEPEQNSFGFLGNRYKLNRGVADVLAENPEVFRVVEDCDANLASTIQDQNERNMRYNETKSVEKIERV